MDDKTLLAVQIKSPKDLGFTFMVFLELVAIFHYHMYVCVNSLHSIDPHILKKKKTGLLYVFANWWLCSVFCAMAVLSQLGLLPVSWPPSLLVGNYVIYNLQAALLFVTGN